MSVLILAQERDEHAAAVAAELERLGGHAEIVDTSVFPDRARVVARFETCEHCRGSGQEPGTQPETCGTCRGQGQVRFSQGFLTVARPCPACGQRALSPWYLHRDRDRCVWRRWVCLACQRYQDLPEDELRHTTTSD